MSTVDDHNPACVLSISIETELAEVTDTFRNTIQHGLVFLHVKSPLLSLECAGATRQRQNLEKDYDASIQCPQTPITPSMTLWFTRFGAGAHTGRWQYATAHSCSL